MPRKRYRYDKDLDKVVEIFGHNGPQTERAFNVLPDIDRVYGGGFVSPIDGEYITSRSQLRRHEIKHNVRQAGDFKRGELIAKENKRVADSMPPPNSGVDFKWI